MNIKYIIFGIIPLFLLCSCQTGRVINLLSNDYRIVNYSENIYNEKTSRKILEIEIINFDKITQINNAVNPIIYIELNNKKYSAIGNPRYRSTPPVNCDYFFPTDENNKIYDFQNNTIQFIGSGKIK